MGKYQVVITDYDYPDVEMEKKILAKIGAEVLAYHALEETEVIKLVQNADVVINQYAPINKKVIDHLPERCVAIGQYGIGVDTIDVRAATERGIVVINVPSYCEEEVAEHALALLFNLVRKITSYDSEVRRGEWDWKTQAPIHRISGRTLGLIGFGKIARKLASKVRGLSLKVISFDPFVEEGVMKRKGVRKVSLEELLHESDFISVHAPLTEETRHLLSAEEFKKMKREAILINVSRGAVIDQDALFHALSNGVIASAGLDVFHEEPPRESYSGKFLLGLKNVCVTPHVAWYSEQSIIELRTKLATDIAHVLQGKRPFGFVNPQVKSHLRLQK